MSNRPEPKVTLCVESLSALFVSAVCQRCLSALFVSAVCQRCFIIKFIRATFS